MTGTPRVVEGAYLRDILDQPRALRETTPRSTSGAAPAGRGRLAAGQYRRLVLTGWARRATAWHPCTSGSWRRAARPRRSRRRSCCTTSAALLVEGTLLVVLSQSGR